MSNRLEYAQRLYESVLDWYNSADSKAQVVLAIDAGFLAFLTSTVFSEPDKLRVIFVEFNWVTWLAEMGWEDPDWGEVEAVSQKFMDANR